MDIVIARTLALLVVAILVAIAARRLSLPYTVGLVLAGIVLSTWVAVPALAGARLFRRKDF